jgi:anthraniloyl-CoA monooxygenase
VPIFAPLTLRGLTLANRVVVSPMCQYRARDGAVGDWHLVHLGSFATGGAGLVFTEMTDVSAEGRITSGCAGLWSDEHTAAWRRIVDFVKAESGAAIGIQLAHAGRKGSCALPWEGDRPLEGPDAWRTWGPSAVPYAPDWPAPQEMGAAEMRRVREEFRAAVRRAVDAGFDVVELHMAHGYLLSTFLSPLSNQRRDAYGGSLEGRLRFPLEVLDAARAAWPEDRPLFVRISATDWMPGREGVTPEEAVEIARALARHGCDVVDVSSGGVDARGEPVYGRMYQVPFAERIRFEAGVRVMAVGAIQGADHANTVLAAGRADLCAIARAHLLNPHLTLAASARYRDATQRWPLSYLPARPPPADWLRRPPA